MSSLDKFARRIINVAASVPRKANELKKQAAGAGLIAMINNTPVDTGQARGGWEVGIGGPPEGPTPLDKSGSQTFIRGKEIIRTTPLGQEIHLTNNVKHAPFLDGGGSPKNRSGMTVFGKKAIRDRINVNNPLNLGSK